MSRVERIFWKCIRIYSSTKRERERMYAMRKRNKRRIKNKHSLRISEHSTTLSFNEVDE